MRQALSYSIALATFFISWATVLLSRPGEREHTLTGKFRMHEGFRSKFLSKDRDIIVYLPPGYETSLRRYPVLYLQDGQNLFDGATSFIPGMEWRVDETAQALIDRGEIEPLIIVGIYNTGEQRVFEYTQTRDVRHKVGGKARRYGRMLVEELKPFIDSEYRTLGGPADTGLGGSSLGGLVTLFLGLRYPKVFGKLAVISPSVWWDRRVIVKNVQQLRKKPSLKIWLDMGTKEGVFATRDAAILRDALVAKGWALGADLSYFEAQGAEHNEKAWSERVEMILKFLFPKK
jgi:predicted alpha/beta superfamily hydrolase